jgi:hypothetical protein
MAMLIVLVVTSSSVNTTTVQIEFTSSLMFPHMETKLSMKARSVSARTSEAVFWKVWLIAAITCGMSSALATFAHHVPTVPGSPMASSRYLWWNITLRSSTVPA